MGLSVRIRSWALVGSLLASAALGSCGRARDVVAPLRETRRAVVSGISTVSPPRFVVIDTPLAWSHDGRTIAFYRWYPSSIGPRGLYLIASDGRSLRYIGGASKDVSFSPDDR